MRTLIIDPSPGKHKQPPATPRSRRTRMANPGADTLVCPIATCRRVAHFSSTAPRVWCGCGWQATLSPDQAAEIAGALAGMHPDLPLATYLMNLHVTEGAGAAPIHAEVTP